jgi:hypothetical protein
MPQSSITPLASTMVGLDRLSVELVEPVGRPAMVRIVWPAQPTLVASGDFPDVAATITQLFARAHIVAAALKYNR